MSTFNINNVNGQQNVFGDHNQLHVGPHSTGNNDGTVLTRDEYFQIILNIIDIDQRTLDDYLESLYLQHIDKNPLFAEILYKDISVVIDGVYSDEDFELVIEDGDFVLEDGDFKTKNEPVNLSLAHLWLHMKVIEKITIEEVLSTPNGIAQRLDSLISDKKDSANHKERLQELRNKLQNEKRTKGSKKWAVLDNLNKTIEMKPNVIGLGLNLNGIFDLLLQKRRNKK